jgi:hypothetical protein
LGVARIGVDMVNAVARHPDHSEPPE